MAADEERRDRSVELFQRGDACEGVLTHDRFVEPDEVRRHIRGWGGILDEPADRFARHGGTAR